MPRRRSPPRLYLDKDRGQWRIRDGALRIRTSCAESDRASAEKLLAEYIGKKHKPASGSDPLIVDILIVYSREHLQHKASAVNYAYGVGLLGKWWGDKKLSDITPANCRAYGVGRTSAAVRHDLEILRAAIRYWHKHHGPLPVIPAIVMPAKPEPRTRWMTRSEAARLLRAAIRTSTRGQPSIARFILLGIYTGSRSSVLRSLRWDWIDFDSGTMRRRDRRASEAKNKRAPIVKLGRRILAHLRRWRRIDGPKAVYVCERDGKTFGRMGYAWSKVLQIAGLDDSEGKVTPHILRHTRATWLMQAGVDLWEAAGHLGMNVKTLLKITAIITRASRVAPQKSDFAFAEHGADTAPFRCP
jgi:integrase